MFLEVNLSLIDSQSTRSNLIESDADQSEAVITKKKRGPKGKSRVSSSPTRGEVQQLALPECSVVLEPLERITRASSKRKAEMMSSVENSEASEPSELRAISIDDDSSTEPKRQKIDTKNIDKAMTTKSKKCHICVDKTFQYLSTHYTNTHEGTEVYCARMSAKNSDKLRRQAPGNAKHETNKIVAYCHYCEKELKLDRTKWIMHLIKHTGEYTRFCSKCNIKVTSSTAKTATCSHYECKFLPSVDFEDALYVYMCIFCNYTQCQEENLKRHMRDMHDITSLNHKDHYTKITLIPNLRKVRMSRRLPSSESESVAGSDDLVNHDVFKSSNQDDDVLSDSFKLMKENSFNTISEPAMKTTTSIADVLAGRFKNQAIKEENVDAHEIIYRSATDTTATGNVQLTKNPGPSSLVDGRAIEENCKIELNKTELNTSGNQAMDDDQSWESCSDDDEEDISPSKSTNVTLNRLLMQKQKPNKRLRNKKRASVKKEKNDDDADDVIDSDKGATTTNLPNKSLEIRPIQDGQKRVDNIAFTDFLGTHKFHCFIGNCDFLSVNNPKSLETHLRRKHAIERWNGTCYACDKQILHGNYSLAKEYDHLMEHHVPNGKAVSKPIIKTPEPLRLQAVVQRPEPVVQLQQPQPQEKPQEQPQPRPKIRIRRFSGDKLSGVEKSPQPSPMQLQPPTLSIMDVSSIPSTQQQNILSDENSEQFYENSLKPWSKSLNTKPETAELKLKRPCSLVALFKCMALDCIFTTSDKDKMLDHLNNHENFFTQQASYSKHHSNQDDGSWLNCCYCDDIPGSCQTLVDHIVEEHMTSIFQCPFCFYRSVDQQNAFSHIKRYHGKEDVKYVLVCGTETKCLTDEINDILVVRQERVKSMQCPEIGKWKQIKVLVNFQQI